MNENEEKLCSVDCDCWLNVFRLRNLFLAEEDLPKKSATIS